MSHKIKHALLLLCLFASTTAFAQINFNNVTNSALGTYTGETWGVSVGDMNGDSWPDIYTGNHRERPSLYRNRGNGEFKNILLTADVDRCFLDWRYMDDHGAGWSDFDADGDDDLLIMGDDCSGRSWSPRLFQSNGLDRLNNVSVPFEIGLSSQARSSMGIAWLDFDQDGAMDFFESANGGGAIDAVRSGAGAPPFGPQLPVANCYHSHSALIVDVDGGSDTEFLCMREGTFPYGMYSQGPGGLVDVSGSVSMPSTGNVVDAATGDFDGDLDSDIFLVRGSIVKNTAKIVTTNRIDAQLDAAPSAPEVGFTFNGGGALTLTLYGAYQSYGIRRGAGAAGSSLPRRQPFVLDPADPANHGLATNRTGRNVWIGYDVASDEWTLLVSGTDYFIGVYLTLEGATSVSNLQEIGMLARDKPMRPQLLRQDSPGVWSRYAWQSGFDHDIDCAGVVTADFDNDMDLDIYAICQNGVENLPNRLYVNDGSGNFTLQPGAGGAAGPVGAAWVWPDPKGWGEAAVTGDFNNDGFIDLFISNGLNNYPTRHKAGPHQLFSNAGNTNHWIELDLVGVQSNPDGLGARVIATAGAVSQLREQNGGYHRWSQSDQRLHFGLGSNTTVSLEVQWPSGVTEFYNNISADALYEVKEGDGVAVITPGTSEPGFTAPVAGDECGDPAFDADLDRGAFLYRGCISGSWKLQTTAGGRPGTARYQGTIDSDAAFSTSILEIEGSDSYSGDGTASHTFDLLSTGLSDDRVVFKLASGASGCLSISMPDDATLYLGPKHIPVTSPFDLNTLQSCQPGSGSPMFEVVPMDVLESVGVAAVQVRLTSAATTPVSVRFATRAETALGGSDFYGKSQLLNFAPGEVLKVVNVTLVDDVISESDEYFTGRLFNNSGAGIATAEAAITILDNDANVPGLVVQDMTVNEADGVASVTVTLTPASSSTVSVNFSTLAQSASGGSDFYGKFQALSFAPGETSKTVAVTLVNDTQVEPDETFGARLFNASGASIVNSPATITIEDDDVAGLATLAVVSQTVSESVGSVDVEITLAPTSSSPVTVLFATAADTATGGQDFYGRFQSITFGPGESSKTVAVQIVNDQTAESTEAFKGRIFNAAGATIGTSFGFITIDDDD